VLLVALALASGIAWAAAPIAGDGHPPLRLGVLRAESYGTVLDALLRIDASPGVADELALDDFAVYVAPADLSLAEATAPRFRLRRLFLKRLGSSFYLDLRQLPPGVGVTASQLIVQVSHGGRVLLSHHTARFLEPPAEELDVALLIDESLSMRQTDPERLRVAAAKTFAELAHRSPRIAHIAIVAFNDSSRTLLPLTAPAQLDALYQAIDRVEVAGQTDMDAALDEARGILEKSTAPARAAVLLTDGKDEPGRYEDAHRRFAEKRWPIYTVGLSERADAEVLRRIAGETGGEYHGAPTNAELQDIFGRICLTLQKKVLIRSRTLGLQAGAAAQDPVAVDNTMSAMTVSLKAREPDVAFTLRNPAGRVLTPEAPKAERGVSYGRQANYQHYDLWGPQPGRWAASVQSLRPAEVTVATTAVTPLLLRAFPLKPTYLRGEAFEIAASLAYGDTLLMDARIEARILPPESAPITVELHDDGRHQDTGPSDGVFCGFFAGSERPGPCTIQLVAAGTTPAGHRFERELHLTTTISAEGYSRLWSAVRLLDLGVAYNGEAVSRSFDLRLTSAGPTSGTETVRAELQPLSATPAQRIPAEAIRLLPSPLSLEPGHAVSVSLSLAIPHDQPAGPYRGRLDLGSKYDQLSLPIQVEVRRPDLVVDKQRLDMGAIESGSRADATLGLRLEPRGVLPARITVSDARFSVPASPVELSAKPATVRISFAAPADHATEDVQAKLLVETPQGKAEVPLSVKVVRPVFSVAPAELDFGQVAPGAQAERQLTLRAEGVQPREATISATALTGPPNAPSLPLAAVASARLPAGEAVAVPVRLQVAPVQPPGAYRGEVVVRTPLGERKVAVTAQVTEADTFQAPASLDFGEVAVGSSKELAFEVASLVDAEQKVEVSAPEPAPDWRLAAEPSSLALPPRGKATAKLRLTASAAAKPGPRSATVGLRGSSRGASLGVRALLFRPPHQSIAFEPPSLDVGRLRAGVAEQASVQVRSLVDEAQAVVVFRAATVRERASSQREKVEATAGARPLPHGRGSESDIVKVEARPREFPLPALGVRPLELTLAPAADADEVPFEATVVARGRSEPSVLRLRGVVFSPPGTTFVLLSPVLDFGALPPGQRAALPLKIQSVYRREQKVSLGARPSAEGVAVAAGSAGAILPPGVLYEIPIELRLSESAPLGERRLAWEVRGPGDSATFEVRVEAIAPPAPPPAPPAIAATEPRPISWQESVLLFLLLVLLLLALVLAFLLTRWLIRTQRLPRMARYLALSALLHAVVLFVALDIVMVHKVQKGDLGPLFKVGLKAGAPGGSSGSQPSVADEIRGRLERERQLDVARQQQGAARIARSLLEAERPKPKPAEAKIERPKAEEKPQLAARPPEPAKLSAEDVAKLLEDIRTHPRVSQARKEEPPKAARTEATRATEVPDMSREQFERAIREAFQPKPTAPAESQKQAAKPDVPGIEQPAGPPKATFTPEDLGGALERIKAEAGRAQAPSGKPGEPAAGHVAASRGEQRASIERQSGSGKPLTVADARASGAGERPAAGRPAFSTQVGVPRSASVEGKASPTLFATPQEQLPSDGFVKLPASPSGGKGEVEAAPIPVARETVGTWGTSGRAWVQAAAASVPGPREVAPARAPAQRGEAQVGLASGVSERSAAKAAPTLGEAPLVEAPATGAPRQEGGGTPGVGPRAVAVSRPSEAVESSGREGLSGAAGPSPISPRAAGAERPSAGSAPPSPIETPGARGKEAPVLAGPPQEAVETGPRIAAASAPRAESAGAVEALRTGGAATIERSRGTAGAGRRELEARDGGVPRPEMMSIPGGMIAERGGPSERQAAPVAGPRPEEPAASRPLAAERGGQAGPVETAVMLSRPLGDAGEPSRPVAPARRLAPDPRVASLQRTAGQTMMRLLLPGPARGGEEAGAIVGTRTGAVKRFVLTTARYGGGDADWDTHKTAMPFLAWQLRERVSFNVGTDVIEVPIESDKVLKSPWVYMTGHKDFQLPQAQAAGLRRYLQAGGTLWAEDCTHEDDPTWDRAFRREIARVLPPAEGYALRKITKADDHPLFRSCFDLSEGYKDYWPPAGDKFRESFIEGIEIHGRLAVIYTRNDYGCGLEIKPDTYPIKASLTGLSPAEMQESSFLMATNILLYALTGGRGQADRGLVADAAASLRKHQEATTTGRDPYDKAPATLFDDFSEENWQVEQTWDRAGSATLRYVRRADPGAKGRRLAAQFRLGRDQAKAVLLREVAQETDLSGQDRCYVEVESRLEGGARLALALITMPDWKYLESRPAFIKPGRNQVHFDLRAATWKTGEPVPEGQSEFSQRPANLQAARRVVLILYPIDSEGTVVFDRIEFRSKP
jgi:uncharacterized protein YegL